MPRQLSLKPDAAGLPIRYDADEGLKKIAVLEAGEKHWARAKDPESGVTPWCSTAATANQNCGEAILIRYLKPIPAPSSRTAGELDFAPR